MITYIYVTDHGQIQRTGNIQKELIDTLPVVAGLAIIQGITGNCGVQYFDTVTQQVINIPSKPDGFYEFNYANKQWEDPRTLQDLKNAQWSLIKQARSQAEYAGFTWDGSVFDSDALSQNRLTGAVTLAQLSTEFVIAWTLQDNTLRVLNQLDMLNVAMELGFHVSTQFTKAQALRELIESATSKTEIESVVW